MFFAVSLIVCFNSGFSTIIGEKPEIQSKTLFKLSSIVSKDKGISKGVVILIYKINIPRKSSNCIRGNCEHFKSIKRVSQPVRPPTHIRLYFIRSFKIVI